MAEPIGGRQLVTEHSECCGRYKAPRTPVIIHLFRKIMQLVRIPTHIESQRLVYLVIKINRRQLDVSGHTV